MVPNLTLEKRLWAEGYKRVIGFDEVGRGALAGPVTVAGVLLKRDFVEIPHNLNKVRDSKTLTSLQREKLYQELIHNDLLSWRVASVSAAVIDKVGIVRATTIAMLKVIKKLEPIDFVILDGELSLPWSRQQCSLTRADNTIFSVAAASIIAKVWRDKLMVNYHRLYPQYRFFQHKGYGTKEHRRLINHFGLSAIHRESFCHSWQKL